MPLCDGGFFFGGAARGHQIENWLRLACRLETKILSRSPPVASSLQSEMGFRRSSARVTCHYRPNLLRSLTVRCPFARLATVPIVFLASPPPPAWTFKEAEAS